MHDLFEEKLFDRFVLFLHMNHKQEDRLYTSYNTKKVTKNVYDIKYMICITMITVFPIQMIYSRFDKNNNGFDDDIFVVIGTTNHRYHTRTSVQFFFNSKIHETLTVYIPHQNSLSSSFFFIRISHTV